VYEAMIRNIAAAILPELTEDLKGEIGAATLKHMTTMLYLGAPRELPHADRLRQAADAALAIDREVERRLEAAAGPD